MALESEQETEVVIPGGLYRSWVRLAGSSSQNRLTSDSVVILDIRPIKACLNVSVNEDFVFSHTIQSTFIPPTPS